MPRNSFQLYWRLRFMDRDARAWKFARALIAKHGKSAFNVARQRAQDRLDKGDYRASSGWARVADILRRMTTTGARRLRSREREPPLQDLLEGQVTEAVMKADNINREELEDELRKAKRGRLEQSSRSERRASKRRSRPLIK